MLQKVIDYEFSTIQQKTNPQYGILKPDLRNYRYSDWNLHDVISKIPQTQTFNLKWIGNDENAHIMSLFYCLVMGSLHSGSKKDQNFIRLKYYLYQLCQQFLTQEEQKLFVQNMCLFQNSKKIIDFLSKNRNFESLIIKIFENYKEKVTSVSSACLEKMEQLKFFSLIFDFISFQILQYNIIKIVFQQTIFYIVTQKQCYFVYHKIVLESKLQPSESLLIISKSRNNSRKKHQKRQKGTSFDSPVSPTTPFSPQNEVYQTPTFSFQNTEKKVPRKQINQLSKRQYMQIFKDEQNQRDMNEEQSKFTEPNIKNVNSEKFIRTQKILERMKESYSPDKYWKKKSLSLEKKRKRKELSNEIKKDMSQIIPEFTPIREKELYQSLGVSEGQKFKKLSKITEERRRAPKFLLEKKKNENQGHKNRTPTQQFSQNNYKIVINEPAPSFSRNVLTPPNRYAKVLYLKKPK